ncbi:HEAT repeat domain-containing protein, partial [Calothrix sp. FACHB-1219]|nr:HEAT repeat domain-containing protein [Calothrix sp. FACHB-168]MBD2222229.1 HEAT repeat domain-containing protein [Calothrix sp. FACHB-1219]
MQKLPETIPSQLDVLGTVKDVAKQGFFVKPVLIPAQIKYKEIVLLIDQQGSMAPFHPLCRQLVTTFKDAKVYYFHNIPTDELYQDPKFLQGELVQSILARFSEEHTLVIIVSDAGAARQRTVVSRWEETVDFLKILTPKVQRLAWLNPLPRFHWQDTTAEEIAKIDPLVPMFALEPGEYEQMVKWLLYGQASVRKFLQDANKNAKKERENNRFDSSRLWGLGFDTVGKIESFKEQFGEPHLDFAYHAAFPLVLTPDLLYCLWEELVRKSGKSSTQKKQFQESPETPNLEAPWYAVSDLLLSGLCQQVDSELYEMEREIRNELLKGCQQKFGVHTLQQISEFLIEYVNCQVNKESLKSWKSEFFQVQQWTALAYTEKRNQAAQALAKQLQQVYLQNNKAELVRLSSVIETLAEPLAEEYEPLLVVAQGYNALVRGDETGVKASQAQLERLLGAGKDINIEGVLLERPKNPVIPEPETLGTIDPGNQHAIAALVQLLQSPDVDEDTLLQAAQSLGKIDPGNQHAIAALVQLLQSPDVDNYTLLQAAQSLGKIGTGNPDAIAALVQLLQSPDVDEDTLLQAAQSLGKIDPGNQHAIAALVQLLQSPDVDNYTLLQAAQSLGKIGTGNPDAIAALVQLLQSPDVDE